MFNGLIYRQLRVNDPGACDEGGVFSVCVKLLMLRVLLFVIMQVAQQASILLPNTPACSSATARHLASAYGDQAPKVLQLAADEQLAGQLVPGHPYLDAEVVHACRSVVLLAWLGQIMMKVFIISSSVPTCRSCTNCLQA